MSFMPLSMSFSVRRTFHWGGMLLAALGVVFVVLKLHSYWIDIDFAKVKHAEWERIVVYSLISGLANTLLALAWLHLLRNLGSLVTRLAAIKIYGVSQLARYLPGNVFHLAGRQVLGMATGISAGILAKSAIWELGLIAVAGSLFGLLILPIVFPGFPEIASISILVGAVTLTACLLRNFFGGQVVWSFVWQMLFLAISGAIFLALLIMITNSTGLSIQHWMTIVGAYIFAWLMGLVTPGAPAGVGIREAVLLLLLCGFVNDIDLLMAALLSRFVTVFGDLLFFLATFCVSYNR